jgi:membrane protein DedA with SNARE-associated domain
LTIGEDELDRALKVMNRHGVWLVLFGRFVPVLRALIALPAGMARMPLRKFMFFLVLGALIYNSVQVTIGMILGRNWQAILGVLEQYEGLVLALGILVGVVIVIVWLVRWRAQQLKNPIDA